MHSFHYICLLIPLSRCFADAALSILLPLIEKLQLLQTLPLAAPTTQQQLLQLSLLHLHLPRVAAQGFCCYCCCCCCSSRCCCRIPRAYSRKASAATAAGAAASATVAAVGAAYRERITARRRLLLLLVLLLMLGLLRVPGCLGFVGP